MPDFPTFPELFRIGRDEILAKNAALSLEAVDRDGSDANVMLAGAGAMAEECVGQLADVAEGLFLSSARGRKLDRYVFDRYGILRKPAAPAIGVARFSTATPSPAAFSIPINTQLQTTAGQRFITTSAATYPLGGVDPIDVPVRSVLAGAGQTIRAGTLTNITSSIPGMPGDLVVTNPAATAGAADAESDEQLRDRARLFWRTAPKGTLAAVRAAALGVPGVVRADIFEGVDSHGQQNRYMELIVADQFTDALLIQGVPPTYEAQSQQFGQTVFNALSEARGAGMFVLVRVAKVTMLSILTQFRFQAGSNTPLVDMVGRATLYGYTNDLRPGQTWVYKDAIAALRTVPGLEIYGDEITSPSGDVVPNSPLEVLRASLSLVQGAQAILASNP